MKKLSSFLQDIGLLDNDIKFLGILLYAESKFSQLRGWRNDEHFMH